MANLLYLPQLKMNLVNNTILAERIFAPDQISDPTVIAKYVHELDAAYKK